MVIGVCCFRSLGQKCLARHIEHQKSLLLSSMQAIRMSPVIDEPASGIGKVDAVNNDEGALVTIRHLDQLKSQWFSVLPDLVYEKMMGYLIECVIRIAVQAVQEADCIEATAATDIGRIYRILMKTKDLLADSSSEESIVRVIPSWSKFVTLTDLLDYSISEVIEWLPRKKFASFTSFELTALIKALFDDSERRQNILNLILEMSG